MKWQLLILFFISLVGVVSATDYCTPPGQITQTINHNGNWYNITLTSATCYTCVPNGAGYGDVECTVCDLTPPASITNLTGTPLSTCSGITWTWVDPTDPDFNHIIAWLNNIFVGNVSAGIHSVTLNGLASNTTYEVATKTVDNSGNVNATFVNDTVTTTATNCTAPSAGTKIIMVQGDSDVPIPTYIPVLAVIIVMGIIIMHKRQRKA